MISEALAASDFAVRTSPSATPCATILHTFFARPYLMQTKSQRRLAPNTEVTLNLSNRIAVWKVAPLRQSHHSKVLDDSDRRFLVFSRWPHTHIIYTRCSDESSCGVFLHSEYCVGYFQKYAGYKHFKRAENGRAMIDFSFSFFLPCRYIVSSILD